MHWWRPEAEDEFNEHLTLPYEVDLSLDPGLYLFNFYSQWQGLGDVSYGFLVEVN